MTKIRFPPFWDLSCCEGFKPLNVSDGDIDWESVFDYSCPKMEDTMLEVRWHWL